MRLRFSRLVKIVYAIVSSVVFGAAVPAFLVMGNSRASIGWGTAALSALMHGIVSHRLHKNRSVHRSASPFLLLWGSAGVFGMGGYGGYCFYLGASEESKLDVSSPYLAGICMYSNQMDNYVANF